MKTASINDIVKWEMCVGCGACVTQDSNLTMKWNKNGFLVPEELAPNKTESSSAIKVCPFNPTPNTEVADEDAIRQIINKADPCPHSDTLLGSYYDTYVGYAPAFRATSSSGGIATYILTQLFNRGIIQGAAVVVPSDSEDKHYQFHLAKTADDLLIGSKTKYYPSTMSDVLKEIAEFDGKVAVVGMACFMKAVRLLRHFDERYRDKIKFQVGIICGGMKSKFYADFLASSSGITGKFSKPEFRVKNPDSYALDYSFAATDTNGEKIQLRMQTMGDMWGSGLFKNNACDFCDDIFTELGDVSLGDAWIKPYSMDGAGHNVIISRSKLAEEIIKSGIQNQELSITRVSPKEIIASQGGNVRHRGDAIGWRIRRAKKKGVLVSPKRRNSGKKLNIPNQAVQLMRQHLRSKSLSTWLKYKNAEDFNRVISRDRSFLKYLSRLNHLIK